MTELKCAICGHKLACDEPKDDKLVEVLYCPTCKHYMLGNYRLWEKLNMALKVLNDIQFIDYGVQIVDIRSFAHHAIEQIKGQQ